VFQRSQEAERVLVAVNFSAQPVSVDTAGLTGQIAVSTERGNESNEVDGMLELLPHEAVVVVEE
jgi:hypothetical protein